MKKASTTLPEKYITIKELKDVFFSLKMNKNTGADEISFNVILFGELSDILRYAFTLSLQIFPDPLKTAKVIPVPKTGDLKEINNYRPISVLSCFSKILEYIMHIRLYSYLFNKKLLYSKQFGSKKAIPQSMSLLHWLIKFMNHLKTTFTHLGFLLIYPRPLTLLIMQYY